MLKRFFLFGLILIVTFVLFKETKIMTWMISSDDMEIEIHMFEKFCFIKYYTICDENDYKRLLL